MGYGGKQANRSGDIRRFNFTGNGSNTAFDLGFTPATQNQLIVTVNGLVQHYDAFSISGSTITFDGTPASGDTIQITAVVDAVGVAAIPDGAVANVSTLTASGAATFSNTVTVVGNTTFSNTTAHTGAATFSNTVAIVGSLSTSTNTATFGTAVYSVANGNIGIGTNTPGYKVHALSASVDVAYAFTDTATSTSAVGYNGSGSTNGVGAPAGTMYMSSYNSVPIVFGNGNTERVRIDTSGFVTKPYHPAFYAYGITGAGTGGTTLTFPSTSYNRGSNYSTSTGRFTCPASGIYIFTAYLESTTVVGQFHVGITVNGTSTNMSDQYSNWGNANYAVMRTIMTYMSTNDYVQVVTYTNGGAWSATGASRQYFNGYFLG